MSDAWIQIGISCMNNTEPNTNKRVTNITDFQMGCWNFYQTNTSGRYITVFLPGKEDFSLCEVRINGKKKDLDNADMSDAWIQIGNSRMKNTNKRVTNITDFKKGCWNLYQTNTSGRYITVFLPRKEDFSLCEVRINATEKRKTKTWENALEYCRTNHRDLASIRNEEEQAWAELEAKKATTEYVWLGLHYTCVLEFWFWVADYPLDFHHWAPEGMTEDCDISVAMKKTEDHQWFSQSVYDKFHFLCEKRNQCLV
ncbi:hypothetical protein GBF38_015929 [Nibea albiflora]|uniref:Uncharacterized protein n=1 Tax=Nibea albiflora TaxID=240163 RepID=A0ACB7FHM2_NIBAL|nr:hypothetical protein GBF38_015929 [Nibea albiflora]